jgi:ribosomal protein S18 acetylase RimI-like enzyme
MVTEIADGDVTRVEVATDNELLCFWDRNRSPDVFEWSRFRALDLLLLHEDYVGAVEVGAYDTVQRYFRLSSPTADRPTARVAAGLRQVDPMTELRDADHFIRRCYGWPDDAPEVTKRLLTHPVYDPTLWVWKVTADGERVGLGVAELDPSVPEGSLEWIQVLPESRRRGIGEAVVGELVRRLADRADLVTVAGRSDDAGTERLYRRCGFAGRDIWWVLKRS